VARIQLLGPEEVSPKAQEAVQATVKRLGRLPNMMQAMANSPAVLNGYVRVHAALAEGTLAPKLREIIAVLVAHYNDCDYCLAAHTAAAKRFHFTEQDILLAFDGKAADKKIEAAVRFVLDILHTHGGIGQEEIDAVRSAGYTDGEIAEMVAVTAAQFYSNFFNRAFNTDLDYPVPEFARRQTV